MQDDTKAEAELLWLAGGDADTAVVVKTRSETRDPEHPFSTHLTPSEPKPERPLIGEDKVEDAEPLDEESTRREEGRAQNRTTRAGQKMPGS
jgi:hypothetical protein